MTKAAYYQRGESLDYKNETTSIIEAGTVKIIGEVVGVIGNDINPYEVGSIHVIGVYSIAKDDSEMDMGMPVFYDGEKITTQSVGNVKAGYAVAKATATDTNVYVKLMG